MTTASIIMVSNFFIGGKVCHEDNYPAKDGKEIVSNGIDAVALRGQDYYAYMRRLDGR